MRRLFLSKVFVRFTLLCVVILLAFFIYSLSVVRAMSFDALAHGLEQGALTVRGAAAPLMARGRSAELEALTRSMAHESGQTDHPDRRARRGPCRFRGRSCRRWRTIP